MLDYIVAITPHVQLSFKKVDELYSFHFPRVSHTLLGFCGPKTINRGEVSRPRN